MVSPAEPSDMELLSIEVDASANWLVSSGGRIQGENALQEKKWKIEKGRIE